MKDIDFESTLILGLLSNPKINNSYNLQQVLMLTIGMLGGFEEDLIILKNEGLIFGEKTEKGVLINVRVSEEGMKFLKQNLNTKFFDLLNRKSENANLILSLIRFPR